MTAGPAPRTQATRAAPAGPPATISPAEWQVRVELAGAYRLADHFGWSMTIFNHITARVPGREDHFLINPFGLLYEEVTASNLLKIDLDGNIVDSSLEQPKVNLAGYIIHSAIHGARPDVACVMHTHTPAGSAVACSEHGLMMINQDAMQLAGNVAYHDFEGLVVDTSERERLVGDLGDKKLLVLRNHGLLSAGSSVGEAFMLMWLAEHVCRVQVATLSMGQGIHGLADGRQDAIAATVPAAQDLITPDGLGGLPFRALLRKLDRIAPDYRE